MFQPKSMKFTPHNSIAGNENVNSLNKSKPIKNMCCMNHPQKTAKYCMAKDLSVSLCSKCAINMAGKGFVVEEINGFEERQRRDVIDRFLNLVNRNLSQYDKALSGLLTKKQDITKYFEQQVDKVIRFHQLVTQQLSEEKDKLIQQLTQNFKQTSLTYEETIKTLQNSKQESIGMKNDVQQNLDRIVKQIAQEPFNEIMNCYHKTVEKYVSDIEDLQRKPIEVIKITLNEPYKINEFVTVGLQKTSLIKKNLSDIGLRTITNEDVYESIAKRDSVNYQKTSKTLSSLPRTPKTESSPFKSVPVTNIDLYHTPEQQQLKTFKSQTSLQQAKMQLAQVQENIEQNYEEGHSQMIERDDVENSYQMMIAESVSDSEDFIDQLNLIQSLTVGQNGHLNSLKMYSSPQFKNR
ncbi:unnamed protein product [Paramecium octaurelia]|uniref:Uncharacterized protein n=1 Tax=Paramecium octaurelia TaxID=43137 RepID=A0A8S1VH71_PAROT|nr:unnamed protein product [Paramecium octaurelia]